MSQGIDGTDGNDILIGTNPGDPANPDGIDFLRGGAGDDVLAGLGDDPKEGDGLYGGAGIDTATYALSNAGVQADLVNNHNSGGDAQGDWLQDIENLVGSAFNDTLIGEAGVNSLDGGNGDDLLDGQDGGDRLDGGVGIDTAYYLGSPVGVTVSLATGLVLGGYAQGDTLLSVENIVGTYLDDTLTGDGGANALYCAGGNDLLDGGAGADRLAGGDGIDTATYALSGEGVTVDLVNNHNSGGDAQGDGLQGIENLVGSAFNDTLIGQAEVNSLDGGNGDDLLDGQDGGDRLDGGAGVDTAYYLGSPVGVTISLATGLGLGGFAQGDTLTNIENLTGSRFDDHLSGDGRNNFLIGGAGADVLVGNDGIDRADYSGSSAGVTVDLALGAGLGGDAQGDTLATIENLIGSTFADHLTGDAGGNLLVGGAGDDTLRGGAAADVLDGGAGSDVANYQGSTVAVTVDLLNHIATGGDAEGDTLTNIENLYGSSFDDHLSGDDGRNIIGGELGNDILVGAGGDDVLSGEGGNDSLDGGDGNDRLVGGTGVDAAHGGTGNDSIDAGTGNDPVFGEAGDDGIYGGAGDDKLDGGDGNDILEGAAGADMLTGGAGIDTISYANSAAGVTVNLATGGAAGGDALGDSFSGIEQALGSARADVLTGNAGANTLWGLDGDDVLAGAGGGDVLKGGAGDDRFVYTALSDSTASGLGKDSIRDFSTGDKIDLSAIDADGNPSNGDTAFTFGTGDYTRHAGDLRVVTAGDIQVVYADVNGDKVSDFAINVFSDHPLTAADFML